MALILQLFVVLRVVDFVVFDCGGETNVGCSVLSETFVIARLRIIYTLCKVIYMSVIVFKTNSWISMQFWDHIKWSHTLRTRFLYLFPPYLLSSIQISLPLIYVFEKDRQLNKSYEMWKVLAQCQRTSFKCCAVSSILCELIEVKGIYSLQGHISIHYFDVNFPSSQGISMKGNSPHISQSEQIY